MVTVAIAEDQRLFRQSLRYLLESDPLFSVIGEASDGQELFSVLNRAVPDLVLMDLHMPKLDGIQATKMITGRWPRLKVIMLSVSDEDEKIAASMAAGARGYILKDADKDEFVRILKDLYEGRTPLSPFLANTWVASPSPAEEGEKPSSAQIPCFPPSFQLTAQEKKISALLITGKSNKEIADRLCISLETVKTHLGWIFRKLQVTCRTEAVVKLLKKG